ncbi:polysaccharide pyruvyl transferase family protein [Propionicimonas sp.]|uniref:polysaccharide pyruvyl transferase family protein n=1 Tax=Propionicimonas sp. TaxID=1955623 RepID=UPI0039E2D298
MSEARPRRVMIRVCQPPDANLPALKSTDLIGGNQGNLLFQFSTARALAADDVTQSYISYGEFKRNAIAANAERINAECDHLVMPMSSSLRFQMGPKMEQWANLIDKLTIPVTVVGIGAQLSLEEATSARFRPSRVTGLTASRAEVEEHEASCRRFLSAVLEHSDTIGVRGEITQQYLRHLGFPDDRIDVIGCPSLFMWGPGHRWAQPSGGLTPTSGISLSFDHRIPSTAAILQRTVDDYAASTVYAQERLTARMVIAGEETRAEWRGDDRFPVRTSHPLYQQHRMLYYPTAWAWIDSLRGADFAFGPRLHGTIAALLAGIPVNLLAHDSRTVEVASYHGVPHTLTRDLDDDSTVEQLYDAFDPADFNARYDELFTRFTDFLTRNGLAHAYAGSGAGLAAFDQSLEKPRQATPRYSAGPPSRPAPKKSPISLRERVGALLGRRSR